jgi:hypothetical protein
VTAREEDAVEIRVLDLGQLGRVGQCLGGTRVLLEAPRIRRLKPWLIALGVERRLPALGRGERDRDACFAKDEIGCGKFFEPEPGLLAGVSQLVV